MKNVTYLFNYELHYSYIFIFNFIQLVMFLLDYSLCPMICFISRGFTLIISHNKIFLSKLILADKLPLVGPSPRVMKPMTKEEWQKEQSILRHVFDEETGRTRCLCLAHYFIIVNFCNLLWLQCVRLTIPVDIGVYGAMHHSSECPCRYRRVWSYGSCN